MKCKDCKCCHKGFFESTPEAYVCTGVPEPFVIDDINVECTEYPEHRNERANIEVKRLMSNEKTYVPYINDDGMYFPNEINGIVYYQLVVSKEMFVEAYNKWIKGVENGQSN